MSQVSIVMTSYNYAPLIGEAIESVMAQTFPDWELLIIDDGSTDNSREVISGFCDRDPRIKLLTHPECRNLGLPASVKRGIEAANGEYIAFLESDDKWHPENLARKTAILDRYPDVAIADDAVELFGEESLFSRYDEYWRIRDKFFRNFTFPANIYTALFYENLIPTFSCVICRSAALKSCSFDYIYAPHLDRSLWLQICRKNRFFHIPEVLTYWRIHPGSCISRENRAYRRNFLQKTYSLLRPCYEHAPWNWSFAAAYCRFILVNIKRSLNNRRTGK